MRLLGRINIDWQSNRVEKIIKEQNESTCRQLAEQFRMLKVNFNLTGKYSDEDHSYIKFKRYEAKADLYESLKKNPINALWHYPAKAFQWLVFDQAGLYATNPLRVLFSMVVSYLVFSFIYVVLQLFSNASITSSVGDPDHLSTIQVALYHSAITFLTIGYGDYYPSGVIRWVSGIEG
ncbi:MAG: two pore domain potassium channel family protein, partial [Bacteroidetes bacterium]|nr:two pore domain potassium channel family protein [Bacteroidota bacterium]